MERKIPMRRYEKLKLKVGPLSGEATGIGSVLSLAVIAIAVVILLI